MPVQGRTRTRIERPALTGRVARGLEAGSVLLVAEAGFGKTTALHDVVDGRGPAWVRCSERSRDPGRLAADVLAAVRAAVPGAVDPLAESPLDPPAVARALAAELDRLLVEPLVLVVDDAEQLAEAPAAAAVLGALLDAGGALRVAVATRRPLPLKLAKLRATGGLTELGRAELAFAADECAAYLHARDGRVPPAGEIADLLTATGGWPLGIALGMAGTPARLLAFLEEEVLEPLPAETRAGILDTCAAEAFDASLLLALGLDDGLPERIEAAGLQLREVEGAPGWLAYQPLVREALLAALERERTPAELRALHARLAPALAAAARDGEAIGHWLAAERWAEAVAAMARAGPRLLQTLPDTGRRWLDALPAEVRAEPACRLLDGQLAWVDGAHARAIEHWRAAAAGLDGEAAWAARFALAEPLALAGAFEEVVELAHGLEGELTETSAGVGFYATMALAALGRAREAQAMAARLPPPLARTRVSWQWYRLLPAGEFGALRAGLEESVAAFTAADPLNRLPHSLVHKAVVNGDMGDDEEALAALRDVEELAAAAHIGYLADVARTLRARLHARRSRTAEAEQELAGRASAPAGGWHAHDDDAVRALVAAQHGDAAAAAAAAERALAIAAPAPLADRHRLVLDLAPVLFESGLPARARELLDDMLALVDERHPGPAGRYARGLLLAEQAWLQWAEGDDEAAATELGRCWAEAGDAVEVVLRRTGRLLERPLWEALGREAIPADEAMRALAAANPDGEPLLDFTRHPAAAVRHAALPLLAASGHPAFSRRAAELAGDADPGVRAAAAARRDPPPLRIAVLGGFRVGRGGWQADDGAWGRRVAQRLVRFLLVHGPDPIPEDLLLEAFWPDKAPRAARHSLQTAVSSARRVLDAPGAASVVEAGERGYRLRLERDAVDCERFERAAAAALADRGPQRIRLLAAADALWSGEPLPEERFADWADAWRRGLSDRHVAVLTALAQERLAAGDVPDATRAARRLVEQDPLNEAGHRTLMTAYARAGRRSEALRQYLECRRALVQQLGVEPAAETADLQRRILAGEPV